MLQSEIQAGGTYEVRWHDGSFTAVRVDVVGGKPITRYIPGYGYEQIGRGKRYHCTNLRTGRRVIVKSAAKFRRAV